MRFALKLSEIGNGGEISVRARHFIRALISEGHEVVLVFFSHVGVEEAFSCGDEARSEWEALALEGRFNLVYCTSAASLRSSGDDPRRSFSPGGLGLWIDACQRAERIMIFGGCGS